MSIMPTADIQIILDWLERIEKKIDGYNSRLNDIDKAQAEIKVEMKKLQSLESLEKRVDDHDIWISAIKWGCAIVGPVLLLCGLATLWTLISHGQPILGIIATVTPFIVTATP